MSFVQNSKSKIFKHSCWVQVFKKFKFIFNMVSNSFYSILLKLQQLRLYSNSKTPFLSTLLVYSSFLEFAEFTFTVQTHRNYASYSFLKPKAKSSNVMFQSFLNSWTLCTLNLYHLIHSKNSIVNFGFTVNEVLIGFWFLHRFSK